MRLSGKNVQPWEEFALDIGGLTLIVGPSNHGKSSIFRALRGVLRNDLPSDFVRNGQDGRLEVVLETEGTDPIKATRTRKGTTKYEIGRDEKGKPIKYEALGDSIPEPMRKLGFGRVQVGETTIDPIFSEQNRAQFLIDPERWKPADLSSVLGAFSSTERLDAGKKEAASVSPSATPRPGPWRRRYGRQRSAGGGLPGYQRSPRRCCTGPRALSCGPAATSPRALP